MRQPCVDCGRLTALTMFDLFYPHRVPDTTHRCSGSGKRFKIEASGPCCGNPIPHAHEDIAILLTQLADVERALIQLKNSVTIPASAEQLNNQRDQIQAFTTKLTAATQREGVLREALEAIWRGEGDNSAGRCAQNALKAADLLTPPPGREGDG